MIARFNAAAGHFLSPDLLSEDFNKKRDLGDGLPPKSEVYMKRKLSHIGMDLPIHQVVHSAFCQTQSFRSGHSTFRLPQILLQLSFTASDCCLK